MSLFFDIIFTIVGILGVGLAEKRNPLFWGSLCLLLIMVIQYMLMRYAGVQF